MDIERISARELAQQADGGAEYHLPPTEAQALAALQQAAMAQGTLRVVPGPDGLVTLPAGVSLDQISVSGRDLIVQLPDGTQMVIVDGAVFVPQIVIGDIEVPPLNLAALLIGNEPQPAAGPPQSSGGNFADPVGTIGDPFGLGDLLPPTALAFPEFEEREILPALADRDPTVSIVTPDNPAGAAVASSSVDEAGLPARGGEPAGSNTSASSETTTGAIVFTAPDGLAGVAIDGVTIAAVGQTISGPFGTLTITAIADGRIDYSYTLADNTLNGDPADVFTVTVTDADGDVATATLTINVIDDVPTARADTDSVAAASFAAETGNVFTGAGTTSGSAGTDTPGADGATVTGVRLGTTGAFVDIAAAGATINGQYGTLTLNADGSYSYTRNAGTPGGVSDVFSYRLTDGDGDVSTTTLTIAIGDSGATVTVPTARENTSVSEAGLPARGGEPEGSAAATPAESTSGSIAITAPDGVASVAINGTTVTAEGQTIATPTGVLTITSIGANAIGYSYTLTDNTSGDNTSDTLTVVITDTDGDSASAPLVIAIADDAPTAADDADSVTEDGLTVADGNVLTGTGGSDANASDGVADVQGADGAVVTTTGSFAGQYGTLVLNADGSYTYTLDNESQFVQGLSAGETLTESFGYTIEDGDGDTSTATLVITINGADDGVIIGGLDAEGGELLVNEDDLAEGSSPDAPALTQGNSFTISTPDGLDDVIIGGAAVVTNGVFTPQTVITAIGTLTVTGFTPVTGADGSVIGGSFTYSYTLTDNTLTHASAGEDVIFESFGVTVTDSDGSTANASLDVRVIDDVPAAADDVDSVTEDGPTVADGNVLTGSGGSDANASDGVADVQGADGAVVTTTGSFAGQYGTLVLNADGSYSYTLDNESQFVQGLSAGETLTESFGYTIEDGDGDTSTATLVITINGADDGVIINGLDAEGGELLVNEDDLAEGSSPDAPALTQGNSFTISTPDGLDDVTIGGAAVVTNGVFTPQTVITAIGTLTVTGFTPVTGADGSVIGGSFTYSYTLTDNTLTHASAGEDVIFESFGVTVTDSDGSTANASLDVRVIDDVPAAADDVDSVTEDGPTVADGNVLTGSGGSDANASDGVADVQGADGAVVTTTGSFAGQYGTLVLNADGSYSYTLDNESQFVQGLSAGETLTESFGYTIEDGDGDTSTATLVITINGADDGVIINGLDAEGGELLVNEDDLAEGSSPDAPALTQGNSFTISTPDGLDDVTIGGAAVVTNGVFTPQTVITAIGTLTVTGFTPVTGADGSVIGGSFTYSYTLTDNTLTHASAGEDVIFESFGVTVTDSDGSTANASLDVRVIDDVPTANADTNNAVEGGLLTVNAAAGVLANDVAGADDFTAGGGVVGVRAAGGDTTTPVATGVGSAIAGLYGTLTLQADGSYVYDAAPGVVPPAGATETFVYTAHDADGDIATTTLTIDLVDSGIAASGDEVTVNEATLATGSNPASTAETAMGTLADNVTGGTGPYSFALVGSGAGSFGTLTLNSDGTYSYTLTTRIDGVTANNGTNTVDNAETFTFQATDANGNTVTSTITIDVIDDVPTARNDAPASIAEDAAGTVGGNVLANDTPGADGATLTSVTIGGVTTAIAPAGATVIATANGTYSFQANGTWSFDPNPGLNNATGIDASFSYVITDGDGDRSSALQPITVTDGAEPDVGAPITLTLDDQNLADGSTPAGSDSTTASIAFFAGSDPIASIVFDTDLSGLGGSLSWTRVSDTQIAGKDGATTIVTLDLVRVGDTAQVTATLSDNYDSHPGIDVDDIVALGSVDVVATDIDGDSATGTVNVSVSDDLPVISASGAGPTLTVDETNLTINATTNFAGAFTSDANADGPGALSYALAVTAGPSGLIDVATGQAVTLSLSSGVVEGRNANGDIVFTVSVDASGNVTLDQVRAVAHPGVSNPDDAVTLSAANLIRLTATITDGDDDTDSATLNIAQNLVFEDDGPSIDLAVTDGDAVLLTTQDAETIGGTSDSDMSTANFGGAFSIAASNFGADNAGGIAWSFALSLTGGPASGLASNGAAINLFLIGGQVVGSTAANAGAVNAGNTIFTLGVNAAGQVTLTQFAEIDHVPNGDTAAPYDDQLAALGTGLVALAGTATITDRDGDTAAHTVTLDLGGNVRFADDGPSISATGTGPTLIVDETDLAINAVASFASVFTADFGADGAGTTSYALGINAGATGLIDVATGQAVTLNLSGGVVEGRNANGDLVFTVSVDTSGNVTLDQIRAVTHPDTSNPDDAVTLASANLVTLTATATDGDGDSANTSIGIAQNLVFEDDGPSIDLAVTDGDAVLLTTQDAETIGGTSDSDMSTANFGGAFSIAASNFGADNAGGIAWSFALSLTGSPASGLASNGAAINLFLIGGQVVGSTAANAGAVNAGNTIFTLGVNAAGQVTLTQFAEIDHVPNGDTAAPYDDQFAVLANGLVRLTGTATITDRDGDSSSDSVFLDLGGNIRFADDGPSISAAGTIATLIVDETDLSTNATAASASLFTSDFGADGAGTTSYALGFNAGATGLVDTATNEAVVLSFESGQVVGRAGVGGPIVFTLSVDGTGNVTLDQQRAIAHDVDGPPGPAHDDADTLSAANLVTLTATNTDGDGDSASTTINLGDKLVFEDDGPAATNDSGTTTEATRDFNTAFVLDFSGSISDNELNTMLTAVKQAAQELFGGTGGDVTVRLVIFASSAISYPAFTSYADFAAHLDSLNPATGGTRPLSSFTDFTTAIEELLDVYTADPTANNQVFFLSDGNPNERLGPLGTSLETPVANAWNSFVDDNDVNVTAIGVGNGIDEPRLQDIDVDGEGSPILVSDFDDLIDTLLALVQSPPITGNVLGNDDFGEDGGRLLSITVGSVTYSWDGATTITASSGPNPPAGNTLSIDTPLGGHLVFNFATGAWSYTAPPSVAAATDEVFTYTLLDRDGDTAPATLTITVNNDNEPTTSAVAATLDDEGLSGGIAGGTGDFTGTGNEAIVSGLLGINYGPDGVGTVSFAGMHGTTATVGTETVRFSWSNATNTLTATIEGGARDGTALFTVQITNTATGAYTATLLDNVLHAAGSNENDAGPVMLTYKAGDANGTTTPGTLSITFDDDSPVIVSAGNVTLTGTNLSATGMFDYEIGADARTTFSVTNGDLSVAMSGLVGSVPTTNHSVTKVSESTTTASFTFSFQYDADPTSASNPLSTATGTLTFDKVADTYTLTLNQTIDSYTTVTTSNFISKESFNLVGSSESQPEIVVSKLANDFFVRFTGVDGGVNSGGNSTYSNGEVLTGTQGWVSISGGANGVSDDNIHDDEVLNMDFYTSSPGDTTTPGQGTARADNIFIKLDQLNNEDMVVILKLIDPDDNSVTTKAIVVANGDIWKFGESNPYGISLSNGQGVIIIEGNDYNAGSQNYRIYGVQLLTSTEGLSGSGINLNRNTGASGSSSGTVAFGDSGIPANDTNDNDNVKVVDIGFIQRNTNTQVLKLDIDVTVTDADGDSATQTLTLNGGVPPVVLDLDGDGLEFVDRSAGVAFDYDGDGVRESTAWVGADDGILAIDGNGNGRVDSGAEVVFGGNGLTDLQGLAARYDNNGDGVLDANDTDFAKFGVWRDANGNGVSDAGEFTSLADLGIASLTLGSDGVSYSAANGDVLVHGETSFTRTNGSTGIAGDVSFATGGSVRSDEAGRQAATGTAGLASALVAASLVAMPAVATVEPESDGIESGETVGPAPMDATEPALDSVQQAPRGETLTLLSGDDQAQETATYSDHATRDTGDAYDPAPRLADDDGRSERLVSPLLPDAEDAPTADAPHAAPIFVDMAVMPAIPADMAPAQTDAAQTPQGDALATVIADALGDGEGVNIDALLAAAKGNQGDPAGLLAAMGGHDATAMGAGFAGAHGMDLSMLAHDAVLAVNHA